MNGEPVILSACRTAIGNFLGGLATVSAPRLGAVAVREVVKRAGIEPNEVDEVMLGHVVQAGAGQAPARQAAIHGGIPSSVPCMTVNKVCGSGLKTVMCAAQSIRAGDNQVVLAGGMESMSNTPHLLHGAKLGFRFGDQELKDAMILDGLWDSFNNFHMGSAAELTAKKSNISREEQDEFAYNSHMKAAAAIRNGKFKAEIVTVEVPQKKGDPAKFELDECVRPDTSIEKLSKLRPAFEKNGTVTAGNAPGLNDGASTVMVASAEFAKKKGLKPLAKIVGYAAAGTDPELLFYAPIYAVRKLMKQIGVDINHWDLIEVNEAFAAQVLADGKELGWDWKKVNVNGGAVALGHPIGASGARILTTLLYALQDRGLKKGLATLCLGGGNALALAVEMI